MEKSLTSLDTSTASLRRPARDMLERLIAIHRELKTSCDSASGLPELFNDRVRRIDAELMATIDALRLHIDDGFAK